MIPNTPQAAAFFLAGVAVRAPPRKVLYLPTEKKKQTRKSKPAADAKPKVIKGKGRGTTRALEFVGQDSSHDATTITDGDGNFMRYDH